MCWLRSLLLSSTDAQPSLRPEEFKSNARKRRDSEREAGEYINFILFSYGEGRGCFIAGRLTPNTGTKQMTQFSCAARRL